MGVVEAVTGESFANYVERSIFAPLKMGHSHTDRTRAFAQGVARGHVYVLGYPRETTLQFEHGRLPTAASVTAMHTGGAPSDGFSYGFGWRDGTIGGVRAVHHGGITPNFRGKMVLLPDSGWGVVVLTNASTGIPILLAPTQSSVGGRHRPRLFGVRWSEMTEVAPDLMLWRSLVATLCLASAVMRVRQWAR